MVCSWVLVMVTMYSQAMNFIVGNGELRIGRVAEDVRGSSLVKVFLEGPPAAVESFRIAYAAEAL